MSGKAQSIVSDTLKCLQGCLLCLPAPGTALPHRITVWHYLLLSFPAGPQSLGHRRRLWLWPLPVPYICEVFSYFLHSTSMFYPSAFFFLSLGAWVWCLTPVIPAFGRPRQEDCPGSVLWRATLRVPGQPEL